MGTNMKFRTIIAGLLVISVPSAALAATTPPELYPVRIGAETARYDRGRVTLNLELPGGAVEIRPVSTDRGQVSLAVAVFNNGEDPANFGIENIGAQVNGTPVYLPSHDQLIASSQADARDKKVATALFAGLLAGAASTMSNNYSYHQRIYTRHGVYGRTVQVQDNTPGVVGAAAAVAGGAVMIHGINRKLDDTLNEIDGTVLQTTTVDPGNSFGGVIVVPMNKKMALPADILIDISWNGATYPFSFRLMLPGVGTVPPFPATPAYEGIPPNARQPERDHAFP